MAFKMKYMAQTKWCKHDGINDYQDYIKIAKQKFPEIKEEDIIYFSDCEGSILEEDFLHDFVTKNMDGSSNTICILKQTDPSISIGSGSTSTLTLHPDIDKWLATLPAIDDTLVENSSIQSSNNSNSISTLSTPCSLISLTKEDFKTKILKKGGDNIFEFYEKNKILNNCLRKLLVNISVDILISIYGYKPSTAAKIQFAKLIIELLPSLKDESNEGYEAFFSPRNGGEGWIAWRLRHVRRNMPGICRKRKADSEKNTKIKETSPENSEEESPEVKDILHFLNNACVQSDKNNIFKKMETTFAYRQKLKSNKILLKFPRFLDTPGLINQDFQYLYPEANNFAELLTNKASVILDIYKKTEINLDDEVINESEWNPVIRSLYALIHMLPPTAKGNKIKKQSIANAKRKLITYKPANLPNSELLEKRETNQPFLVAEGTSIGTISQYSIVIDGNFIPCETNCTAAEAFVTLFKTHYVFKVEYENSLYNFWKFMQGYFFNIDLENIKFTSKMLELRSRINAYNDNH